MEKRDQGQGNWITLNELINEWIRGKALLFFTEDLQIINTKHYNKKCMRGSVWGVFGGSRHFKRNDYS